MVLDRRSQTAQQETPNHPTPEIQGMTPARRWPQPIPSEIPESFGNQNQQVLTQSSCEHTAAPDQGLTEKMVPWTGCNPN